MSQTQREEKEGITDLLCAGCFHILISLALHSYLRHGYDPHLTDEENEPQRGSVTSLILLLSGQGWNSGMFQNPGVSSSLLNGHQLGNMVTGAVHLWLIKSSNLGPAAPSLSYCGILTIYIASLGLNFLTNKIGRHISAILRFPTLSPLLVPHF